MINDVTHLFMYLLAITKSYLVKHLFKYFAYYYHFIIKSSWILRVLYIFKIQCLYQISVSQIVYKSVAWFFIFISDRNLQFWWSPFINFFPYGLCFWCFKKCLYNPRSQRFSPIFSSRHVKSLVFVHLGVCHIMIRLL